MWKIHENINISIYLTKIYDIYVYDIDMIYRYVSDAGPLETKHTKKDWPYFYFLHFAAVGGTFGSEILYLYIYICTPYILVPK